LREMDLHVQVRLVGGFVSVFQVLGYLFREGLVTLKLFMDTQVSLACNFIVDADKRRTFSCTNDDRL
jgi:hypothetical protein